MCLSSVALQEDRWCKVRLRTTRLVVGVSPAPQTLGGTTDSHRGCSRKCENCLRSTAVKEPTLDRTHVRVDVRRVVPEIRADVPRSGLAQTADAVPPVLGHVGCLAQGNPDVARGSALAERDLAGDAAELGQHQVVHEHPAIGLAELLADGDPELTQAHDAPGNGRAERLSGPPCRARLTTRSRRARTRA